MTRTRVLANSVTNEPVPQCRTGRPPAFVESYFRSLVVMRSGLQRQGSQLHQPFQVLRQRGHQGLLPYPIESSQPHSPEPHEILALAEQFLDLLPEALRDRIARAARLALGPLPQCSCL